MLSRGLAAEKIGLIRWLSRGLIATCGRMDVRAVILLLTFTVFLADY